VIFTSGSTGQPKGVILQHRPVINLIQWVNESFRVGRGDRLLFITSLCFDLSVYDIFGILAAGGEIYIATEAEMEDPAALARVLYEKGITFWDSAPAALQRLTPFFYTARGADSPLRLIFLSGDWIPLSLPPTMRSTFPAAQFVGLGGATEATIWSNYFIVDQIHPSWKSVPYGMPIQNATYYCLDERLNHCPVGVPGDLHIGGGCLSFGYFGQPALTAQRYIPDPYSRQPGGVLYCTGDRVMRWADGNLEFLGRLDEQVKIRGFRIELGEIEAVLRKHPAVLEAKALAREFGHGDKRLVAYVQIPQGATPEASLTSEAREALIRSLVGWARESLPEYMVPSAFVPLEQWPVTANGKLDRKALPEPEIAGGSDAPQAPETPTEIALAEIWSELLNREGLGVHDNFFDLGGHSLLATQVISAVRSRMGEELPLRELFAHPTVATLAQRVDDLQGKVSHLTPLLVHVDRSGHLPLSFSQERMWFLNRLEPDSGVYNIPAALRLSGSLDYRALSRALAAIIDRQEGLRTSFEERESVPLQRIHDRVAVILPLLDLQGLPAAVAQATALRIAERDAALPFRLDRVPFFRTTLIRLGSAEHIILLNLHHIVSDGWSTGVMLREFVHFYNRAVEGGGNAVEVALSPLSIQYADYAVWQRKRFAAGDLNAQLEYWRRQLKGMPPALELPTDRPRKGAFRFHGGAHRWLFPKSLLEPLRSLMQQQDVTLFILLLSAFMALLQRYSGQQDVVVGSPVANRNRKETEPLIGLFVNTLVLRADLGGNPSFADLLARVKAMAVAAYDHQDLPFEKLVETLNPDRDLSRNPLFQIVFMVQNALTPALPLTGLEIEVVPVENQTAKFDLTMDLEEQPDRLLGRVEYNADTFDATTIQRMMGHYIHLLEDIAAHPQRRLRELNLLGDAERNQVVNGWNDTALAVDMDRTLDQLFSAQALRAPEAVAARLGEDSITYGAVERLANRVAQRLLAQGIGRGDLVTVCFPRCLEMLPGLLGVLKSGAAYVPLDPAYPVERMRYILERTGARVLLTHGRIADRLAELAVEVWPVEGTGFDGFPEEAPPRRTGGDDLAYIIFTSGSTGEPKGVVLQHGPVVNLIEWVNTTFHVGPGDRLLFLTSLCFDLSVYDIFGILAAGAAVEIAQDEDLGNPERLMALLDGGGITFWDSAPAALQQLVPFLPPAGQGSPDLRLVFLSGDWVPLSLPPAMTRSFPNARVIALGGATEAAIWSNFFPVEAIEPHWRSVPYGRPIQNAHYHVLDSRLRPCPVGVPGDLYIGQDCLSLCYFQQPGLTAQRYVPDPFSGRGGDVLYTTGDRARWLSDGNLEFLGRLDHQVKIRGFRIELGEVEGALRKFPAVKETVVLAREDRPGDKQLAAYVELRPGSKEPADELAALRGFLRERLPEYMLPPHILVLESWPVTANGKLDRKALPAPAAEAAAIREAGKAAPRTPVEEVLVGLWADVLALPEVGIHDDFFALGGHSILIAQLVGRIRAALGIELPIRRLFELPTVAKQAEVVEEALRDSPDSKTPPMTRWRDLQRVPLSYAQERLWLQYGLDPSSGAYNVPVGIRLRGRLRPYSLYRAVAEIVRRHEALRAVFHSTEQGALASIDEAVRLPWRRLDLAGLPEEEREATLTRLAEQEAAAPFQLESRPLIRGLLLELGARDHALVVTVHHIAFDGLSVGVLVRELSSLYSAFIKGRPPELPALEFQYGDFAAWQRQWLTGATLDAHLDYWQQQLAGAPPYLELPSQKPRPPIMTDRGGVVPFQLGAADTAALVAVANHHGCTLFMILLAAFKVLLHHQTRAEDVVVGTDVGGRTHAALQPMIGFFVNQLALRTSLAGTPTFSEILARVRRTTLDAYNHQEAPFHKVVERLNPPRDRSRTPVVQLKLVYQENPSGQLRLGDLELSEMPLGGQAVKFDIWLNIWPAGGGLQGRVEYNRDVLATSQVEHLMEQLSFLLGKVAYNPELPLNNLDRALGEVKAKDQRKQLKALGKSLFQRRQRSAELVKA
jgi:amino acid adenylation domain-containing protein